MSAQKNMRNEDTGHIVCWATSVKHKNMRQQWNLFHHRHHHHRRHPHDKKAAQKLNLFPLIIIIVTLLCFLL